MKTLFVKDIRQLWRTFRLPALLLSGLFFAILDPIGARYMPQIMEQLLRGAEGITIIMPELGPADALISYFGNVAQMGAFIVILTAMGAVAREREQGVSAWLLTRPVGRLPYLYSKYAAYSVGVLLTMASGTLLAALYTTSLLGVPPLVPTIWGAVFMFLYLELILIVALSASALLRSQIAAGGVTLVFLIMLWLPQLFLDQSDVGKYMPYRLSSQIGSLLKGNIGAADFLPALPAAIILGIVAQAVASLSFRRAEL
ncbi:MAG: ABC transporter permease subunit [Firmicutes bacterium]|jgi:ABC-2 type transport system permease protein|nr:ABC transporter permease subunit [Bacillota bacterium]